MKISIAFLVTALVLAGTFGEARPLPSSRGGFRAGGLARVGPATTDPERSTPPHTPGGSLHAGTTSQTHGETVPAAERPNNGQGDPVASPANAGVVAAGGGNSAAGGDNTSAGGGSSSAAKMAAGLTAWVKGNSKNNTATMINSANWPIALMGQGIGAHMAWQNMQSAKQDQASVDAAAASSTSTSSTAPASTSTASLPDSGQYQRRSVRGGAGRTPSHGGELGTSPYRTAPLYQVTGDHPLASPRPVSPGAGAGSGAHSPVDQQSSTEEGSGLPGQQHAGGGALDLPEPHEGQSTSSQQQSTSSDPPSSPPPSSSGRVNALGNLANAMAGLGVAAANQHAMTIMDDAKKKQQQQQKQQAAAASNSTASNSTSTAAPAAATSRAVGWDFGMPVGLVA